MSYRETARAFAAAENGTRHDTTDRLPMSEWAESRGADMAPQTIAHNHAAHVSDTAHALREALDALDAGEAMKPETLTRRARALLAAIGEAGA